MIKTSYKNSVHCKIVTCILKQKENTSIYNNLLF